MEVAEKPEKEGIGRWGDISDDDSESELYFPLPPRRRRPDLDLLLPPRRLTDEMGDGIDDDLRGSPRPLHGLGPVDEGDRTYPHRPLLPRGAMGERPLASRLLDSPYAELERHHPSLPARGVLVPDEEDDHHHRTVPPRRVFCADGVGGGLERTFASRLVGDYGWLHQCRDLGPDEEGDRHHRALPPRVVLGPDEDGIKKIVHFRYNELGNMVKVTTRTRVRLVRRCVTPRVAAIMDRRSWEMFGDAADDGDSCSRTVLSREDIPFPAPPGSGTRALGTYVPPWRIPAGGDMPGKVSLWVDKDFSPDEDDVEELFTPLGNLRGVTITKYSHSDAGRRKAASIVKFYFKKR